MSTPTLPTDHEQYEALAVAWAVNALEPADLAIFEAHRDGCERCTRAAYAALEIAAGLAYGVPDVAPPPLLRQHVLAAALQHRPHGQLTASPEQSDDAPTGRPADGRPAAQTASGAGTDGFDGRPAAGPAASDEDDRPVGRTSWRASSDDAGRSQPAPLRMADGEAERSDRRPDGRAAAEDSGQPGARPSARPAAGDDDPSGARPGGRPAAGDDDRSGARPSARPAAGDDGRSDARPGARPAAGDDGRSGGRSSGRAAAGQDGRSEGPAAGRRASGGEAGRRPKGAGPGRVARGLRGPRRLVYALAVTVLVAGSAITGWEVTRPAAVTDRIAAISSGDRTVATVVAHRHSADVVTDDLPPNTGLGTAYYLWGVPAEDGGTPQVVGTFQVTTTGLHSYPLRLTRSLDGYPVLAISEEKAGSTPSAPSRVLGKGALDG